MRKYINAFIIGICLPSFALAQSISGNPPLAGTGTVTSVGITPPSGIMTAGSPVTSNGSVSLTLDNQTANKVLASPNGSAGTPTFRALNSTDMAAILASNNTFSNNQTISGSSAAQDGLLFLSDSVTGTVTGSLRPDSLFINRTYNGTQSASGYTSAGDALHPYIGYGTSVTTSSGSVALLGGNINIYNSSNGPAGRSEFTPIATAVVPIKGGTFVAGSNYYNDFNIQSAPGTGGQEGFLAGGSFAIQKWTSGNTIDANHAGSYGLAVTSVPNNTGYDSQNHTTDTTYPLNAMITLNGWSGQQTNTASGGQVAAATAAANIGLKIGGVGGSVWSCSTCYSYIPTGIDISDYTTAAIHIGPPNAGHATSGVAINIDAAAGNLVVGDSIFVGSGGTGGTVQAYLLKANAPSASTQAFTYYSDQGTDKWLIGKQTDNSFIMYDSANAAGFLSVTTAGLMTIGENKGVKFNSTTFANLPTCNSTNQGIIAFITDASAAISAWHQTVSAGGGSTKTFVQCNATNWLAF
jgi:hypothetical protein